MGLKKTLLKVIKKKKSFNQTKESSQDPSCQKRTRQENQIIEKTSKNC